jgi:hypothetical protein
MRTTVALLAVLAAALAGPTGALSAEPEITWRVDNPFRFFLDPADTEAHRVAYESLSEEERRQPILATERILSEKSAQGWAASVVRETCWDVANNRFTCPGMTEYAHPKLHRVRAELTGIPDATDVTCTWLTAPAGGRRGTAVTKPCNEAITLDVPYPGGATVSVEVGGVAVARTTMRVTDLFIVGLGDSFGSGAGNPDVPVRFSRTRSADYGLRRKGEPLDGYPAREGAWKVIGDREFIQANPRWLDQACNRSLYSHQLRAALQLAIEDPHRAVTFAGLSCSGAESTFGLFLRYKGHEWVPNPPALSQISAVAEVQCGSTEARAMEFPEAYHMNERVPDLKGGLVLRKCEQEKARKIDLVLLSIGGNDIGFARLVANAVLADESVLKSLGGWFGQVHGFNEAITSLDRLDDRYRAVRRAIHNILHVPWGESDRVLLTAYPPLSLMEDGRTQCPDGRAGMTVLGDFLMSAAKAREGDVAAQRMTAIMKASARSHGWTFVDAHVPQFAGRGLCAGWTDNALNSADDLRMPRLVDGTWVPFNPADWRPYASRQRWFRTPNDAFMTGHFHVGTSLLRTAMKSQGFEWLQILLASTYSGSFHPTAEGHAAIADAVADKARPVLEKYAGRSSGRRAER